jgi:hypothetical protein
MVGSRAKLIAVNDPAFQHYPAFGGVYKDRLTNLTKTNDIAPRANRGPAVEHLAPEEQRRGDAKN